jgi:glycosyltransferase involved in cell wall biosynthesis
MESDTLWHALKELPADVCFVICGSGELEDEIRAQVDELKISNRVLFKGFVNPKELPLLMKASDAFIRPSLSEGLGNAFLEAMAARIPIIGTTVGGIRGLSYRWRNRLCCRSGRFTRVS